MRCFLLLSFVAVIHTSNWSGSQYEKKLVNLVKEGKKKQRPVFQLKDVEITRCPTFCDHNGTYNNTPQHCIWPPFCCEHPTTHVLFCCINETLVIDEDAGNFYNCGQWAWVWWEQYWRTVLGVGLALGLLTFICSVALCLYQTIRDKRRRRNMSRSTSDASDSSRTSGTNSHDRNRNRRRSRDRDSPPEVTQNESFFFISGSGGVANPSSGELYFLEPIQPPPYTDEKPPPYVP